MKGRYLLIAFVIATGTAFAQKESVPKAQDKLSLAEENAKALLLLMDTDKNGKVSKQEWMKFMEAEFDRLDKNKNGELDPKEIKKSMMSVKHVPSATLGK